MTTPNVPLRACRKCGAPLSEATDGAYRGLLYCLDFCDQFGPGEHANALDRLRVNLDHAETWAVASAMTPQHAESVRETFREVFAAFDGVVIDRQQSLASAPKPTVVGTSGGAA